MTHRLTYYDGRRPQAHVENLVVDTVNERVGIGTVDPSTRLDVEIEEPFNIGGPTANSFPIASFIVKQTGSEIFRGLEIGGPPGGPAVSDAPVYLKTSGTSNRFAILNEDSDENFTSTYDGLIGIGTATPFRKLHIKNDGTGPTSNSRQSAMIALHDIRPDANIVQQATVITFRNPIYNNHIITNEFFESSAIQHRMLNSNVDTDGGVTTSLSFFTCENAQIQDDLSPHLSIVGSKVGIGTTTPSSKLEIVDSDTLTTLNIRSSVTSADGVGSRIILGQTGDSIAQIEGKYNGSTNGTNKDLLFYSGGDISTPKMILKGDGNVGINTSTPATKLEITESANVPTANIYGGEGGKDILTLVRNATPGDKTTPITGQIGFNVDSDCPQMYFNKGSSNFALGIDLSDSSFKIVGNKTLGTNERLTITPSGNVAIDSTTFCVDAVNDRVGIGTVDPTQHLDVSGNVNAEHYYVNSTVGASGTFTTTDSKTVTVENGIITSIAP